MGYFVSDDSKLYYELHGEGEPILILPGGGTDGRYYLSIVEHLKKHFTVILPDPRGTGRSERGNAPYTFETLSSDACALLHHLKINKAHIFGHSMGGMVAQHFANQNASMVETLILFATSNKLSAFGMHCCKTAFVAKMQASTAAFIHIMAVWNFSDHFFRDNQNLQNLISGAENDPYPTQEQTWEEQMELITRFDSSGYLPNLSVPTQIIGCEKDIVFSPDCVSRLKRYLPNAKHHQIENAAHSVHLEEPEKVFQIILNFLDS